MHRCSARLARSQLRESQKVNQTLAVSFREAGCLEGVKAVTNSRQVKKFVFRWYGSDAEATQVLAVNFVHVTLNLDLVT
jgi:hypothetical protein